ncbi:MAG TPA: hypothetical protein VGT04_01715 [Acidobacteriaceae bacterium]|nr:hypothetical protein [Acidobacteriaceae bacterium]
MEEQLAEKESATLSQDEIAHRRRLADAQRQREKQALELQHERILNERTSNPNRRAALEAALADIEAKLKSFS